jgi:hypothetical protein
MIFTDDDRWLDFTTGLLEPYDAPSFASGHYFGLMTLSHTLSGIGSWYFYQLPTTVQLEKLNVVVRNAGGVVGQDAFSVSFAGEEINPAIPLDGVPLGDMLDTTLATVAGTCNGAGTGIEAFQGILGDQRVRSHIDTVGNRTSVDYGP